jgi:hypothetical protein
VFPRTSPKAVLSYLPVRKPEVSVTASSFTSALGQGASVDCHGARRPSRGRASGINSLRPTCGGSPLYLFRFALLRRLLTSGLFAVAAGLNQEARAKKEYATAIFLPRERFLLGGRFANG